MEIMAYVADGYLAFKCDGIFAEPVSKVMLSSQTRMFTVTFKCSGEAVELDCPVDDELLAAVKGQDVCGFGFFFKDKLLASSLVPLEVGD